MEISRVGIKSLFGQLLLFEAYPLLVVSNPDKPRLRRSQQSLPHGSCSPTSRRNSPTLEVLDAPKVTSKWIVVLLILRVTMMRSDEQATMKKKKGSIYTVNSRVRKNVKNPNTHDVKRDFSPGDLSLSFLCTKPRNTQNQKRSGQTQR